MIMKKVSVIESRFFTNLKVFPGRRNEDQYVEEEYTVVGGEKNGSTVQRVVWARRVFVHDDDGRVLSGKS